MRKLLLTCACGQDMLVPETAVGRTGLCPGCGEKLQIGEENTRPYRPRKHGDGLLSLRQKVKQDSTSRDEAARQFAQAVDLYQTRRYAEAYALLDGLIERFPGNPHVEQARDECMRAMQGNLVPALEYQGTQLDTTTLSEDLVRGLILDKMCNGATEEIQLKAAELAARVLGMCGNGAAPQAAGESGAEPGRPARAKPFREEIP